MIRSSSPWWANNQSDPHPSFARAIQGLVFSPDGKRLVSARSDSTLKVWDTGTGAEVLSLHGHTSDVSCVAISPDGKRIASGSADRTMKVWDAVKE